MFLLHHLIEQISLVRICWSFVYCCRYRCVCGVFFQSSLHPCNGGKKPVFNRGSKGTNSYFTWRRIHRKGRKEGNVIFSDALNTFYLRLYGVGHMVKDHSDSERGNPLPAHGPLFPIKSKGSFICTIPQTG